MPEQQCQKETMISAQAAGSDADTVLAPPPPPDPSTDPILETLQTSDGPETQVDEIFKIRPHVAMTLFSAGLESLVSITGDVPPTPPPADPIIPHMRGIEAEKKSIVRSNSEKNLARLLQNSSTKSSYPPQNFEPSPQPCDDIPLRTQKQTFKNDSQTKAPLPPHIIIGEGCQPVNVQHAALVRKFYCRKTPPFTITEYLKRIHRYLPLSTGVYLATAFYIHRLAIAERAIVVTERNVFRLVIGGLRVAMKALEDHSYSHKLFAKFGGVSEKELSRLEICFCYLTNFELVVDQQKLRRQWELLKSGGDKWATFDQPPEIELQDSTGNCQAGVPV